MLSRKGDGKLIKRKKRKDIQALRSRTRRKSSLGIRSVRKSPFSARSLFGKVSLCAFGKEIKEQVKKASLTIEAAFALPLFFFGMVTMIHFMEQTVPECKGSRNVCVCGGRRRSRRNYAS